MSTYVAEYDLYYLYDRQFDDCIALLHCNVPDSWPDRCPADSEIELVSVSLSEDTADFLKSRCTDIEQLLGEIRVDIDQDTVAEAVIDSMIDELGLPYSGPVWDEWYDNADKR